MPSYKTYAPLLAPSHHLDEEDGAVLADSFSPGFVKDLTRTNPNRKAFSGDDFRMYEFKVRRCMHGRNHVWADCPFAHPGEKARRRDPRRFLYSGEPCPDFRHGSCRRGDACGYAHGVFEFWLHPSRYRTELCKDGKACTRKVCFFAHSMRQLRRVGAPVEEIHAEVRAATMDSHASELYTHTHEVGTSPMSTDFTKEFRIHMVDSHKHEMGLPLATNSLALISGDVYDNVGFISETLPMLTLSSQALPSSNSHTEHMSEHSLYTSASPRWAQAVARQTFLTHEGYGLSSPTSTLAGPLYLSPFSSPPLSPLSTPSGWIYLCNNSNSEGTYKRSMSQVMSDNMQRQKVCDRFGEEGPAENAMPDLGWVHELVM